MRGLHIGLQVVLPAQGEVAMKQQISGVWGRKAHAEKHHDNNHKAGSVIPWSQVGEDVRNAVKDEKGNWKIRMPRKPRWAIIKMVNENG